MPKRIFIFDGHPAKTSLSRSLAEAYADEARKAGHEVRISHLSQMSFDPDHGHGGYKTTKPLEPCLEETLANIEWAEHVVLAAPMWWGGLPAKLKGFFDRAFLPGRTFDTRVPQGRQPKPMLTGRTGRIILTSDTPGWVLRLVYANAVIRQIRGHIFAFVGIKPARVSYFSGASHPKPGLIDAWLSKVGRLGGVAA